MNQNFNKNTNLTKIFLKRFCKNTYNHINTFFQSRITTLQKTKPKHIFRANITTLRKEEGNKKQGTLMVLSQGAFNPPVLTIEKSSHRLLLFSLGERKSISTHSVYRMEFPLKSPSLCASFHPLSPL